MKIPKALYVRNKYFTEYDLYEKAVNFFKKRGINVKRTTSVSTPEGYEARFPVVYRFLTDKGVFVWIVEVLQNKKAKYKIHVREIRGNVRTKKEAERILKEITEK